MKRTLNARRRKPSGPEQVNALDNAPQSGILQYTYSTPKLEEIEDVLNRFVAPQRLISVSRAQHAEDAFEFLGGESLGLFKIHFGQETVCELLPEETDDRIAFVSAGSMASRVTLNGQDYEVSKGKGALLTSGSSRLLHFDNDAEHKVLLSDQGKLLEVCSKLLGHEAVNPVRFDVSFNLEEEAGRRWMNLLQFASAELENKQSLLMQSQIARKQIEDMVLTGLLLCHANNYSNALLRPQSAAAPFYVKRAEAFIEAHFADPLSLAEIAARAGVSARSLQNGFQQFRGMTPMAFLRSIRLQRVHEALRVADPTKTTVTEIALACGFSHMGEFGTLYKRTYGVTPGQTLLKLA
ncbi:helix-turn-helix domain-containing protein [Microvirga rosea]|uniref:helix-turn-helix domain-containing protein n=1 Tax=Microvirga rosea TaxID=2715425 RepID=UPI001D0A747C|nr:AraC family transcriptional regulator [Microvirga rosea]MCB8822462.1 AraC family transcriptional regulator [Microvirga rosea]